MYNRTAYILTDAPIKKDLLRLFSKDTKLVLLDIGGCEGEESARYSRVFPEASIFVFEPLPKNQQIILDNIKNYGLKNVELIGSAVSDASGSAEFYVSSGHPDDHGKELDWDFGNKSSSLLPPGEHISMVPWLKFDEMITVPAITLDNFLRERNIPEVDFIHMDVQGAELRVLAGAKEKIKNVKVIWLEVADITLYKGQPVRTEIESFMKGNGFYLVKSTIDGQFGDQLYLNQKYFKTFSFFNRFFQFHCKKRG